MSTFKPRRVNGLFVLVGVVGLMFGSAGPAAASHAYSVQGGAGNGVGYELGPNFDMLCVETDNELIGAQFETTYYVITHNATYTVRDAGVVVASYTGLITSNIQHGDMVSGPHGSQPGECPLVFAYAPVPLTKATVTGSQGGGAISCTATNPSGLDSYDRISNDMSIDFRATCSVTGNTVAGSAHGVPVTHVMSGKQTICQYVAGGCADPNAGSRLTPNLVIS